MMVLQVDHIDFDIETPLAILSAMIFAMTPETELKIMMKMMYR